jgi:molybdopterin converting factor small subunit
MNVTVRFLGALRDKVGAASLVVEVPTGGTYRDVLDAIEPTVEPRLPGWAWDSVRRSFSARLLVSLKGAADLRDETVRLSEGDEVVVVLPLGGG